METMGHTRERADGALYRRIRDTLAAAIRIADGYRYGGGACALTRGRIYGDLRRIRSDLDLALALCRSQGSSVSWGAWLFGELEAVCEHTVHDWQAPSGVLLERMFRMYRLSYTLSYLQLVVAWEVSQLRVKGQGDEAEPGS